MNLDAIIQTVMQGIPPECFWYVVCFVVGLFFPQVRLADLLAVVRASKPATAKDTESP